MNHWSLSATVEIVNDERGIYEEEVVGIRDYNEKRGDKDWALNWSNSVEYKVWALIWRGPLGCEDWDLNWITPVEYKDWALVWSTPVEYKD